MKTPLRRRLLNNLNRQRNRLIKQRANLEDIDFLFNVKTNEKLSTLSTNELKQISNKLKQYGSKTVLNDGRVMTEKFLKNYKKTVEVTKQKVSIPKNLKQQVNSKTFNFNSPAEVKKHFSKLAYNSKNRYVERIKSLDKKLGNRLERMSLEKFNKMLQRAGGLASFDRVFANSPKMLPQSWNGAIPEDELEYITEEELNLLSDIDKFSKLFR